MDLRFMSELIPDCPDSLKSNLGLADRLAPLMTSARQIAGNPRLIKRFLNTLSIRMSIAKSQEVAVDEEALAKMLLFERCAEADVYNKLIAEISDSDEGKPTFLAKGEKQAQAGEELDGLEGEWNTPFVRDWLALRPPFADMDLRSVVYVSREHMPIISPSDQLSSEAADILEALLGLGRGPNVPLVESLQRLPGREVTQITERLMARARQEQVWGTPPVFWGFLTVIEAEPGQASQVAEFFRSISTSRLRADVIPALFDFEWAKPALDKWGHDRQTSQRVKEAINAMKEEVT